MRVAVVHLLIASLVAASSALSADALPLSGRDGGATTTVGVPSGHDALASLRASGGDSNTVIAAMDAAVRRFVGLALADSEHRVPASPASPYCARLRPSAPRPPPTR